MMTKKPLPKAYSKEVLKVIERLTRVAWLYPHHIGHRPFKLIFEAIGALAPEVQRTLESGKTVEEVRASLGFTINLAKAK